jgi:hypothetical protein
MFSTPVGAAAWQLIRPLPNVTKVILNPDDWCLKLIKASI